MFVKYFDIFDKQNKNFNKLICKVIILKSNILIIFLLYLLNILYFFLNKIN